MHSEPEQTFEKKATQRKQAPVQDNISQRKVNNLKGKILEDNRAKVTGSNKGLTQRKSNPKNTRLSDNLKSSMADLSGMSLDRVKVHNNTAKPAATQAHAIGRVSDVRLYSRHGARLRQGMRTIEQKKQQPASSATSESRVTNNDRPQSSQNVRRTKAREEGGQGGRATKTTKMLRVGPLAPNGTTQDTSSKRSNQQPSTKVSPVQLLADKDGVWDRIKNAPVPYEKDYKSYQPADTDKNYEPAGLNVWGEGVISAQKRQLDEWYALKEGLEEHEKRRKNGEVIKGAMQFGTNVKEEPDAHGGLTATRLIYDAVENKYVTGNYRQINANIDAALAQLTTIERAAKIRKNATARVSVADASMASKMLDSKENLKGVKARWRAKLRAAAGRGNKYWPKSRPPRLRLIVTREKGGLVFDETAHPEECGWVKTSQKRKRGGTQKTPHKTRKIQKVKKQKKHEPEAEKVNRA